MKRSDIAVNVAIVLIPISLCGIFILETISHYSNTVEKIEINLKYNKDEDRVQNSKQRF